MKRHTSRLLGAALALSLLAACSADKDTSGAKTASDATSASKSSSAPGASAEGDTARNGSGNIGIDQPDPSKVIFSKQFAIPGEPQHKTTVGILSLSRQNQVLILKVVVTPDFADKSAGQTIKFREAVGDSFWSPTLLDMKNLKKYRILTGTATTALTYQDGEAVNGQPIYGWAAFAPPPEGVQSIDVTMTDWMPRITNVPIT